MSLKTTDSESVYIRKPRNQVWAALETASFWNKVLRNHRVFLPVVPGSLFTVVEKGTAHALQGEILTIRKGIVFEVELWDSEFVLEGAHDDYRRLTIFLKDAGEGTKLSILEIRHLNEGRLDGKSQLLSGAMELMRSVLEEQAGLESRREERIA